MIDRIYYPINEALARSAQGMWSFTDYKANSETNEYRHYIDKAYEIVDLIQDRKPQRLDEALTVAERYARKLAEYMNKSNSIEMQCPSVMISGGSNFPVRKKEKQNAARDRHQQEWNYLTGYVKKLQNILTGKEIIKSADDDAIERLQEKLQELEKLQQAMKDANIYYKKNNTLQGFTDLKQSNIDKIMDFMTRNTNYTKPFESYSLTNNNAKIKATKDRIKQLEEAKATPTQETAQSEFCKVVENTEEMRIQLLFDGKPDEATRIILKANGFRWAPSQSAWQRQLTDNARYSTKRVLEQLKQLNAI